MLGYLVPENGAKNVTADRIYNQRYLATIKSEKQVTSLK